MGCEKCVLVQTPRCCPLQGISCLPNRNRYSLLVLFFVFCSASLAVSAARERGAWISGNSTTQASGNYVDRGTASSRSYPGARSAMQVAYDSVRQEMILYGGVGFGSPAVGAAQTLNDLWGFRLNDSKWTLFNGNGSGTVGSTWGAPKTPGTGFSPGSRFGGAGWFEPSVREFFLFGGSDGRSYPSRSPDAIPDPRSDFFYSQP
jgi:hypothetical protein